MELLNLRQTVIAALIALLIGLAVGFPIAWFWQGARADARISKQKLLASQAVAAATTEAAERLKAANRRADAISTAAAARDQKSIAKLEDVKRALKSATKGRRCLDGSALRVLNGANGISVAMPGDSGSAANRSATVTADSDASNTFTADSQVADWIATAGDYYDRCRSRISDIRDWNKQ